MQSDISRYISTSTNNLKLVDSLCFRAYVFVLLEREGANYFVLSINIWQEFEIYLYLKKKRGVISPVKTRFFSLRTDMVFCVIFIQSTISFILKKNHRSEKSPMTCVEFVSLFADRNMDGGSCMQYFFNFYLLKYQLIMRIFPFLFVGHQFLSVYCKACKFINLFVFFTGNKLRFFFPQNSNLYTFLMKNDLNEK